MSELRRDMEHRLGAAFSPRRFHDELLAQGSLPMWAQRKALDAREPRG